MPILSSGYICAVCGDDIGSLDVGAHVVALAEKLHSVKVVRKLFNLRLIAAKDFNCGNEDREDGEELGDIDELRRAFLVVKEQQESLAVLIMLFDELGVGCYDAIACEHPLTCLCLALLPFHRLEAEEDLLLLAQGVRDDEDAKNSSQEQDEVADKRAHKEPLEALVHLVDLDLPNGDEKRLRHVRIAVVDQRLGERNCLPWDHPESP